MKGLVWWAVLIISHSWEKNIFFSAQAWKSFSWDTEWQYRTSLAWLRSLSPVLFSKTGKVCGHYFIFPTKFPMLELWVSSWHCCTNPRVVVADPQGGVTNPHAPLHQRARQWAGTNTQHLERGVAHARVDPWALPGLGTHGALQCPVLPIPVSTSSNIHQNHQGHILLSAACLVAPIKFNETIILPKRV